MAPRHLGLHAAHDDHPHYHHAARHLTDTYHSKYVGVATVAFSVLVGSVWRLRTEAVFDDGQGATHWLVAVELDAGGVVGHAIEACCMLVGHVFS